jgi:hypothetical protein
VIDFSTPNQVRLLVSPPSTPLGDVNHDYLIDASDIDGIYANLGSANSQFDLNADGLVTQADVDELISGVLGLTYGDADLNGAVSFVDFQILLDHWQSSGQWAQGDFTGDGMVDFADFQKILDFWSPNGFQGAPVPEPASIFLLCLGALPLLRKKMAACRS